MHVPPLFAAARERLGEHINLMHDVHSRLTPKQAVALARAVEPYRFGVPGRPDRTGILRPAPSGCAASPVPIAVGERIGSVTDAVRLVRDGGVDLLRLHTSAIGGLTPTRKVVATAICIPRTIRAGAWTSTKFLHECWAAGVRRPDGGLEAP